MLIDRLSGPALLSASAATIYTTPAGGALLETIDVSNPSGSPVDLTISIGTDAAGTRIYDGLPILADSKRLLRVYLPLSSAEVVQAKASTGSVLNVTLNGKTL
jgi:hypothetical protein